MQAGLPALADVAAGITSNLSALEASAALLGRADDALGSLIDTFA